MAKGNSAITWLLALILLVLVLPLIVALAICIGVAALYVMGPGAS